MHGGTQTHDCHKDRNVCVPHTNGARRSEGSLKVSVHMAQVGTCCCGCCCANMTSVRRKRLTSRRGRPPQMPSRRSPSPHHLEGCYERGHNDGLCQGVYDKGKLDGYNEGRHAHVWHGEEDDEDEKPSWRAVRRGRNDSESSDSSSEDSEDTSTSGSSEQSEDSERMETMTNGDENGFTRRSRSSKKNWQS